MYRRERRIPTILGLLLIFLGIGSAVYFDREYQSVTTSAQKGDAPVDVHVTNVSDASFSVSWLTTAPSTGVVKIEQNGTSRIFQDDADSDNLARLRTAHYVTVTDLRENTLYTVTILNAPRACLRGTTCVTVSQKTAPRLSSVVSLPPLHGVVWTQDGVPAPYGIIYVVVGTSAVVSSRTDSAGLWAVPLTQLRTQELTTRPNLTDDDVVSITVVYSPDQKTTATTNVKAIRNNAPVPPLRIGNAYNFLAGEIAERHLSDLSGAVLGNTAATQGNASSGLSLFFPRIDNDTTHDGRPRFRGAGVAGGSVEIVLESPVQRGTVVVQADGSWTWRPARTLPPGSHRISIRGLDQDGKLLVISRSFVVLKSGESVLGESTPSASLTPTIPQPTPTTGDLSPTPTEIVPSPTLPLVLSPSPTYFPLPTATPVYSPRAGGVSPTLLLIGIGVFLLGTAAALSFLP